MSIQHRSEVLFGMSEQLSLSKRLMCDWLRKIASSIASSIASLATHEIEVAAFVGLKKGLVEQMRVATFGPVRRGRQFQRRTALFKLSSIDQKIDASFGDIEPDRVAGLHQRQRTADGGFRRDMQHDG